MLAKQFFTQDLAPGLRTIKKRHAEGRLPVPSRSSPCPWFWDGLPRRPSCRTFLCPVLHLRQRDLQVSEGEERMEEHQLGRAHRLDRGRQCNPSVRTRVLSTPLTSSENSVSRRVTARLQDRSHRQSLGLVDPGDDFGQFLL